MAEEVTGMEETIAEIVGNTGTVIEAAKIVAATTGAVMVEVATIAMGDVKYVEMTADPVVREIDRQAKIAKTTGSAIVTMIAGVIVTAGVGAGNARRRRRRRRRRRGSQSGMIWGRWRQ